MANITSLRLDAASKRNADDTPIAAGCTAMAKGLTPEEAQELADWLKGAGFASVEINQDGDHVSVVWTR